MKEYHYTECGLDNIYLLNGFEINHTPNGEEIFIHDINGLNKTIGIILISKPGLLSGKEIRFIRHMLDLSQKRLANIIGIDYQSVLRWEKNKGKISKTADRFIKMMFFSYIDPRNTDIYEKINEIADLDATEVHHKLAKITLEEVSKEWRECA